jgi:hypothetical protein
MPKGTKHYTANTKYNYFCSIKQTERTFETEQQYDTYLNRHAKMCPCKGAVDSEMISLNTGRNTEFIINDLSM